MRTVWIASVVVFVHACGGSPAPERPELVADPPRTPPPEETLSDERRLIDAILTVERDLHSATEALKMLDDYDRRFPHGQLAPEAAILRQRAKKMLHPDPIVEPVIVPVRTLRYREIFTGSRPTETNVHTWTVVLGAGGLVNAWNEREDGEQNSLIAGRAKPLGALRFVGLGAVWGRWSAAPDGGIDLLMPGDHVEHCTPGTVLALEPGAPISVSRDTSGKETPSFRPGPRKKVDVIRCDRGFVPEPAWQDEPQPLDVPLADLPGIEYAHDDEGTTWQKGALRRIPAGAPEPVPSSHR
jgi:hypothetical protein